MITLYGAQWCPDCRRSKAFLSDQRIAYEYIDLELDPDAMDTVLALNGGKQIIPTIVFDDGSHLAEPSNAELADKLGLSREAAQDTYDLVVIGGGPTGLTTAIYAAREDLSAVVIDRSALGGQAGVTERLDNYPGFPEGIGGGELAQRFVAQAERYGVEMLTAVSVNDISREDDALRVSLSTGQTLTAGAVLLAVGSTYRRTGADGEEDLIGAGVHFCATCDGPFYKDAEHLVVLGGGNSGLEEGLFLSKFARHVTILERDDTLRASKILQTKVADHDRMTVRTGVSVISFEGDESNHLDAVRVTNEQGEPELIPANAAFVFIGLQPNTDWLDGVVDLDAQGFITTDRTLSTSLDGVFAAGDVRADSTKQLASAVGEGAAVALQIRAYLNEQRG